jgi:4-amino-4-deoxy-L-arabinose transferase-like glycosyltransferase
MLRARRLNPAALACLILSGLFAVSTAVWVSIDRSPPNWDDAWYLTNSLNVYDGLTGHGIAGYLSKLNSVFGFKAPLIAALPAPFYLLLGRDWHAAFLVNIAAMLVLFFVLARIARHWRSPRAAVFAIAIAGAMPLLYGLSRWFMVEYAMTALLAAAVCVLIEADGLKRDSSAVCFGVLCGLGLLLKISFPLFILPPFIYLWTRSGRRVRALVLAAVSCLILAVPWYAGHFRRTFANALDAGFGAPADIQGTGAIFSVHAITTYFAHVARDGVSWYFVILAVPLCVFVAFRARKQAAAFSLTVTELEVLFAWLFPFVIFAFAGNKDIRYIAPVLPAVALLLAFLLDFALPANLAATAIGCALLIVPVVQMFAVSFGIPYQTAGGAYTRRYASDLWPQEGMLKLLAGDTRVKPGEKTLVLVGVDRALLNANNVELASVTLQLPFNIETTAHEPDLGTLRARLAAASWFIYKTGGEPESPAFNPYAADLIRSVQNNKRFAELPYSKSLPDGGVAHIVKNLSPGQSGIDGTFVRNAPRNDEKFGVGFGSILVLTNIATVTSAAEVALSLRWRSLKPPYRDYWCFTHLLDRDGKVIAQHDHRLLGGEPPLLSWQAGDAGDEEIHLALPAGKSAEGLLVRFGLYDPPSGDRLKVDALQGVAAKRFTVVDSGTALVAPVEDGAK